MMEDSYSGNTFHSFEPAKAISLPLFLFCLFTFNVFSIVLKAQPPHRNWTNDFEHIFTSQQIKQLDSICTHFQQQSGVEITVLTLDSNLIGKQDFATAVLHYAQVWAAANPTKPMGVLFAISRSLKRVQIQKSHGIALIFTNAESDQFIAKSVVSELRKGNYYLATRQGVIALSNLLMDKLNGKSLNPSNSEKPNNTLSPKNPVNPATIKKVTQSVNPN